MFMSGESGMGGEGLISVERNEKLEGVEKLGILRHESNYY